MLTIPLGVKSICPPDALLGPPVIVNVLLPSFLIPMESVI